MVLWRPEAPPEVSHLRSCRAPRPSPTCARTTVPLWPPSRPLQRRHERTERREPDVAYMLRRALPPAPHMSCPGDAGAIPCPRAASAALSTRTCLAPLCRSRQEEQPSVPACSAQWGGHALRKRSWRKKQRASTTPATMPWRRSAAQNTDAAILREASSRY